MIAGFREIVAIDFEFVSLPGERPVPVCCVVYELCSGRRFRLFQDELRRLTAAPFATGPDVLFVCYYASAELGCYRALGWEMPARILDLFTEFRNHTNNRPTPSGSGLIGALTYFGLESLIAAMQKKEIQEAIGTNTWQGKYTPTEILDYCETDVIALQRLLPAMLPHIDLPRALLRGRSMAAASALEYAGVPIDVDTLKRLRAGWTGIQDKLIAAIDCDYGVYDGRTFKRKRFEGYLARKGMPWRRTESGQLDLSDDTFRQQAKADPGVSALRELRSALSEMRLEDLAVGHDGRNRTMLSAFRAKTGRNQPSNTKYIFGPSVWLRGLIKPPPGYGVAYIDFEQEEFGIAAALSGDRLMQEAYLSGDPYLAFAKQAGAVPADATKKTHPQQRDLFKQCVLAVQYGMQAQSLALKIGQPLIVARDLLRAHRQTYKVFWQWSDAALDTAMLTGKLHTVFGWTIHVDDRTNPRMLQNYLMQGNGAELLRLSCCLATEAGVEVVAPVHDALMICAPLDRIDADIAKTRAAMAEASRLVIRFEIGTDVSTTLYPNRYMDARGRVMWDRVMGLLAEGDVGAAGAPEQAAGATEQTRLSA